MRWMRSRVNGSGRDRLNITSSAGDPDGGRRHAVNVAKLRLRYQVRFLLLTDHLHQHALFPPPIEFAVEDLLPWTKVQLPVRDRDDDLAPHELPLDVRVAVVLAGKVVPVVGCLRGEPLEKVVIVPEQAGF